MTCLVYRPTGLAVLLGCLGPIGRCLRNSSGVNFSRECWVCKNVFSPSALDLLCGVFEIPKPVLIQTLVPETWHLTSRRKLQTHAQHGFGPRQIFRKINFYTWKIRNVRLEDSQTSDYRILDTFFKIILIAALV